VALTRAKYGLIVCGNAKVLGKQFRAQPSLWVNLLSHYKKYELVVEGSLSNLRQCHITFSKPMRLPSRYHAKGPIGTEVFNDAQREQMDMDYYRGPGGGGGKGDPEPSNGYGSGPGSVAQSSAPMQAPSKYFNGPSMYSQSQSLTPSQRSSDRSQASVDRMKKKGKNLRKTGGATMSQGSAYSQNMMSQDSYTAFDDYGGLTSQESQSQTQNTQDL